MKRILKQYYGYDMFRFGQEEIIMKILQSNDVLGVMPTGAGKSICYQVPALILPGITIVISPLISLMKDQVQALCENGIPAAFINSSLTPEQSRRVFINAKQQKYKIIYIAPERLDTETFCDFAQGISISMIAVDEAHCVSQWGHDFRPSYLNIKNWITLLSKRPVAAAFTATATEEVKQDITKLLGLRNPYVMATGFNRSNLYFEVQKPSDKYKALTEYINQHPGKSGIIYCSTRKSVEELCIRLNKEGYSCTQYHAGLSDAEKSKNQDDFLYDRKNLMSATNAFGMGIDKSNISFVIHYNMPKDMESYYQEAGRAGRDGSHSDCLLLYNGQDVATNKFLIDNISEETELEPEMQKEVKRKQRLRLKRMAYYCHSLDCLRQYILNYFGDVEKVICGNCSNCLIDYESADITVEAQKILSCISRMGERFGIKMLIDTLRGAKTQRILSWKLDKIKTYGIMQQHSESEIHNIVTFLISDGCIGVSDGEFPVLFLTDKSKEILFHNKRVSMKVKQQIRNTKTKKTAAVNSRINQELFERLKALRLKFAHSNQVPAFIIFSDATLTDMCLKMPLNEKSFLQVSGVGQKKLEQYGSAFLELINSFNDSCTEAVLNRFSKKI